ELREQARLLDDINKSLNEGSKRLNEISTDSLKSLSEQYRDNLTISQSLVDLYGIQDKTLLTSQDVFEEYLLTLLRSTDITNEGIQALHGRRDALLRLADVEKELAKRGEEGGGGGRLRTVDAEKKKLKELNDLRN